MAEQKPSSPFYILKLEYLSTGYKSNQLRKKKQSKH